VYIPEFNRVEDSASIMAFIRAYPFAVLVSNTDDGPFATHVPILVREREGKITLVGHVARANPHWKLLQQGNITLVIFHGPHAYISPRLYESSESVPTWNYAAVHVYGHTNVFCEPGRLQEILMETFSAFDIAYLDQWAILSEKYRSGMLKHIVGFEITAAKIEGKFKLSQNRSKRDQAHVIQFLQNSNESTACDVARLMKEQGLGL
jgi:transcriptional regulator